MLSIASISGGKSNYYAGNDAAKGGYYLNGTSQSYWGGGAKDALGLTENSINPEDFDRLYSGHIPEGRLGNPTKEGDWKHDPGRDLTFSDPKSVSILAQGPLRDKILNIRQLAVVTTMGYLEKNFAETRIGGKPVGGQKIVWAAFSEDTSRADDPNTHTHVVLFNIVKSEDGKFRSLHNQKIYDNSVLLGQIYRAEVSKGMRELGFQTEPAGKHGQWEIKEVPQNIRDMFSKRRQAILAKIDPSNDTAKSRELISVITRPSKTKLSRQNLTGRWNLELAKFKTNFAALSKPTFEKQPEHWSAKDAIRHTMNIVSETNRHLRKYTFMREVMDHTHGNFRVDELESAANRQIENGFIVKSECGEFYMKGQMLRREKAITEELQKGHLNSSSLASKQTLENALRNSALTDGQKGASRLIALSNSRFVKIQGYAGTGKTTALRISLPKIRVQGYKLIGLSTTGASTQELTDTGVFDKTMTLQKYLLVPEGNKNTVLVIDESSMIGTNQMLSLLRFANQKQMPRIVFMGDAKQMGGVQAGEPFQHMEKSGVRSAVLDEIMRQNDHRHRKGVSELTTEKLKQAFETLRPEIHEVSVDKTATYAIEAWQKTNNAKTPIIVQTNRQKQAINQAIKADRLKGAPHTPGITIKTWQPIYKSDTEKTFISSYVGTTHIRFNRDYKSENIQRGDIFKIEKIDTSKAALTISKNGKRQSFSPAKRGRGKGAIELYKQEDRTLHKGDRIRFTRGGTGRSVNNNDYGTVKSIAGSSIKIMLDRDKTLKLSKNDPAIRHIDHAWASTTHAFQGKTVDHAIVVMPSRKSPLTSLNSLYTAASRHRLSLTIVTDDASKLRGSLEKAIQAEKIEAQIRWPEIEAANKAAQQKEIAEQKQERDKSLGRFPKQNIERDHAIELPARQIDRGIEL